MMGNYYYHPVCHLLNGRRLYFFFISIKSSLNSAADDILNLIKDPENGQSLGIQLESQCSYFVIGETDVLL